MQPSVHRGAESHERVTDAQGMVIVSYPFTRFAQTFVITSKLLQQVSKKTAQDACLVFRTSEMSMENDV